jgi:hypothetical protein
MGAQEGQTYAADALNKQLVEQLMTRYQKYLMRHFRQRALIVAEAQEHYDYEERDGRRFVKMEEVLEIDEETGERRITEQPALLVPDLRFSVLNFRDEDTTRQFTEALRASGIPISARTRTRGLGFDLDEERERSQAEAVEDILAQSRTRRMAYLKLMTEGLPVPQDLQADFAAFAQQEGVPPAIAQEQVMIERAGVVPPSLPDLAPTPEDMMAGEDPEADPDAPPEGDPEGDMEAEMASRPPESDEERDGMPVAAARREPLMSRQGALYRRSARVRSEARLARAVDEAREEGDRTARLEAAAAAESADVVEGFVIEAHAPETQRLAADTKNTWFSGPVIRAYDTPAHVGIRRHLGVTADSTELLDYEVAPGGR